MPNNLVIIGLGGLGKRHLQGASYLRLFKKVIGYDLSSAALELTHEFCRENQIPAHFWEVKPSWDETLASINSETIVIDATTAHRRAKILEAVILKRPRLIITEKPVCQSAKEYEKILALSKKLKVPVHVDFLRHAFPLYQALAKELNGSKLTSFYAMTWGGYASSGMHVLELMAWLLQARRYEFLYSSHEAVFPSKRKGFNDFAGTIVLKVNNHIVCSIVVTKDPSLEFFEITTQQKQMKIYELQKRMILLEGTAPLRIKKLNLFHVSQTTELVLREILRNRSCPLPNLQEAYLVHKILFDYLNRHRITRINFT